MIAYDVDPSLHTTPPAPPRFDDGFAPPVDDAAPQDHEARQQRPASELLETKSDF